jgi:hypothetical protein
VVYYSAPQPVLTFAVGSGLSLSPLSSILPATGRYTIGLQARMDGVSGDGYSKLVDFANGTLDPGLYDYFGHLDFYSYPGAGSPVIGTGYGDIVLTRDKSGAVAGYYNGNLQFWTSDSIHGWGVVNASDILRFFVDDSVGSGTEMSSGAVARIRVWNDALSAADVRELTDTIFHDGFEGP